MKNLSFYLLSMVILMTSCNGSDEPQNNTFFKLTVGVHSWPGGGVVYIGDELGYFKEEGIDLEIKKIESFDTKRASLIGGSIDIDIANTLDQVLIYRENDFPAQIIGITDESVGGDGLVAQDEITSLDDLVGKTIAYAEASPSDFYLRYVLDQNGIDLKTVKLKPVADPQIAGNAIIAKQVDAAVTYDPFLSQAANEEGISMLSSTKDYPTLIPGLLIANSEKVTQHEKHYAAFLRAWFKSADYYYKNRAKAEKIIAEGMEMDLSEVQEILAVVSIQTKEDNQRLIDKTSPNNLHELVDKIGLFWMENGFVSKRFKSADIINTKLISE